MSQNQTIALDLSGLGGGDYSLIPANTRNGVFTWTGQPEEADSLYDTGLPIVATASVRPGRSADFTTGVERVKRKTIVKMRIPVHVPGADGDIVDYIDTSIELSAPVECSPTQVGVAAIAAGGLFGTAPIDDMVGAGREPY